MANHQTDTCPICAPIVGSAAYRRGVARAEALKPPRVVANEAGR